MAAAVPEVSGPEPVARYLETGLRLGRHLDGLVDAYYGPADLADRVASEPQRPLPALVADLRVLVADLDAGDGDLDIARRRWLRAQTIGLHTAARQLAGETVAFVDEVESCYGVRPEFVDHEVLAEAHRRLEAVLPGSGSLAERYDAWRTSHLLSPEQLTAAVHTLADAFRERTRIAFGLPEGEQVVFEGDDFEFTRLPVPNVTRHKEGPNFGNMEKATDVYAIGLYANSQTRAVLLSEADVMKRKAKNPSSNSPRKSRCRLSFRPSRFSRAGVKVRMSIVR